MSTNRPTTKKLLDTLHQCEAELLAERLAQTDAGGDGQSIHKPARRRADRESLRELATVLRGLARKLKQSSPDQPALKSA